MRFRPGFSARVASSRESGSRTPPDESRRELLSAAAWALAAGAAAPVAAQDDAITPATLVEAAKIHVLLLPSKEADDLARTIEAQVAAVKAVRAVPRPLALQPALVFDPRLPGVRYPPQGNRVALHAGPRPELPARDDEIAFAPVIHLSHWIQSGQLKSRRLTEIYLDRIRRIDGRLLSFITATDDLARRQADRADRETQAGQSRGPLHGIPYGIKDLFDTAGISTTWGAEPYRDRVPESDAAIVTMLADAGAVLLGKLATGALANGATWFGGQCRNPWNTEEAAGGSSTGSGSATAAGLCGFSIGTDSLGSILNPADRCGVVGLRATFGRIPTAGAMPLTPSLDRIGPLTRGVEDAALVLAAIKGPDPTSATSIDMGFDYDSAIDLSEITVGTSASWFENASQAHQQALSALRSLGMNVVDVEMPDRPYLALINNLMVEAATIFEELTLSGRDRELPVDNPSAWPHSWRQIRFLSAVDYLQFERLRRLVMQDFHQVFERVDLLFGPTYGSFELLMAMNFTGHPGLGMRAGFVETPTRGLSPATPLDPAGPKKRVTQNVAFHGRLFEEGKMISVARALEEKLGVWAERPPL